MEGKRRFTFAFGVAFRRLKFLEWERKRWCIFARPDEALDPYHMSREYFSSTHLTSIHILSLPLYLYQLVYWATKQLPNLNTQTMFESGSIKCSRYVRTWTIFVPLFIVAAGIFSPDPDDFLQREKSECRSCGRCALSVSAWTGWFAVKTWVSISYHTIIFT